jgi:hypothetical protein
MDNLFPVSVVDNFFDNPDKVLKLVDSLKFTQSKGFYPGKRTKSLHLLKYDFYHSVICKVLSLFDGTLKSVPKIKSVPKSVP